MIEPNFKCIAKKNIEHFLSVYLYSVTSSEKVDKENRYANFRLACLPYPGCEFFKSYRDNCYSTANLFYNWKESYNDAKINVPDLYTQTIVNTSPFNGKSALNAPNTSYNPFTSKLNATCTNATKPVNISTSGAGTSCCSSSNSSSNSSNSFCNSRTKEKILPNNKSPQILSIDWDDYQNWDLKDLTLNYMRASLAYLQDNNSGLLVHCISGWDRTPLFISLLRISLWADGLIHQTLTPIQLLYFTIAYE